MINQSSTGTNFSILILFLFCWVPIIQKTLLFHTSIKKAISFFFISLCMSSNKKTLFLKGRRLFEGVNILRVRRLSFSWYFNIIIPYLTTKLSSCFIMAFIKLLFSVYIIYLLNYKFLIHNYTQYLTHDRNSITVS